MARQRTRKSVAVTTMSFNIQEYLASMRTEQKEDHEKLAGEVNAGLKNVQDAISSHTKADAEMFSDINGRLKPIESMRRTMRWATGIVFVSFVGLIFTAGYDHFKHQNETAEVTKAMQAAAEVAAQKAVQAAQDAAAQASAASEAAADKAADKVVKKLTPVPSRPVPVFPPGKLPQSR